MAQGYFRMSTFSLLGRLSACVLLFCALTACTSLPHAPKNTVAKSAEITTPAKQSASAPELLAPGQTFTGGWLTNKLDANGFPLPGPTQGFSALVSPTALAVRGTDLYVADSGTRKLYRLDTVTQTMSVMPGIVALPWTQMQVGSDHSLYVLDPMRLTILHFSRGLQPLRSLGDPAATISLSGFVLDVPLGQIVASDRISQRLVMFSPIGGPAMLLDSGIKGEFRALGALATDGHTIYAVDGACFCISALDEAGRGKERIGQGVLAQPRALAADRYGHIFVADAGDRTLKVFLQGKMIANYPVQTLRLIEISALAVDEDVLYVADSGGSKILSFRIQTSVGGQR